MEVAVAAAAAFAAAEAAAADVSTLSLCDTYLSLTSGSPTPSSPSATEHGDSRSAPFLHDRGHQLEQAGGDTVEFAEFAERIHFCGELFTLDCPGDDVQPVDLMALPLHRSRAALIGGRFVGVTMEGDRLWSLVPLAVTTLELCSPRYGFQVHHQMHDVAQPLLCVAISSSARLRWMSSIQAQISLPFLWGTAPGPSPFDDFGDRLTVTVSHPLRIGRFGPVFPGVLDGADVQVTLLSQRNPSPVELVAEAAIMNRLRHPCLLRLFGLTTTPDGVMMVLEAYHDSLRAILSAQPLLLRQDPSAFSRVAMGLASGLGYLHAQGLIHGTLSPDVVLVNLATWSVRIGEFGLGAGLPFACSCGVEEELIGGSTTASGEEGGLENIMSPSQTVAAVIQYSVGTPGGSTHHSMHVTIPVSPYQAPESIPPLTAQHPFPTASDDLYSFGIILWEMYNARIPFRDLHGEDLASYVKNGARPELDEVRAIMTGHSPDRYLHYRRHRFHNR